MSILGRQLKGNGTELINGINTNTSLGTAIYTKLTIESDGTEWFILA